MAVILLAFAVRLMQAVNWFPAWPGAFARGHTYSAPLAVALNAFVAQMWPSPYLWLTFLTLGALLTIAGMQQTVAAFNVARTYSDKTLTDTGEDDSRFLTSVAPEWLLWDIILRRAGMGIGMMFFAQYAFVLAIKTGLAFVPFLVLTMLCSWVDNRLLETSLRLTDLIRKRRAAEGEVMRAVRETGFLHP